MIIHQPDRCRLTRQGLIFLRLLFSRTSHWRHPLRKRIIGTGVMLGTVIGVGFLALPYAAAQAGILTVLGFLALLAFVVIIMHVAYADVVLSTDEQHRLPGYAYLYLGIWGKRLAGFSVMVGGIGNLLLYLLFGGSLIALFFPADLVLAGVIIFWGALTALLFLQFRTSSLVDALASWILVGALVVISMVVLGDMSADSFVMTGEGASWILPYGVVLFSLLGLAAVPELGALSEFRSRRVLPGVIAAGIMVAALLYAVFTVVVLGAIGPGVSQNALLSVYEILPRSLQWILPLIGVLAIGTSYFMFGHAVKKSLELDFGFRRGVSFLIVAFAPLALFLFVTQDITSIIVFLGGIWISVDAILIFLMREQVSKKNGTALKHSKLIGRFLILFFIIGTISSIIALFGSV